MSCINDCRQPSGACAHINDCIKPTVRNNLLTRKSAEGCDKSQQNASQHIVNTGNSVIKIASKVVQNCNKCRECADKSGDDKIENNGGEKYSRKAVKAVVAVKSGNCL